MPVTVFGDVFYDFVCDLSTTDGVLTRLAAGDFDHPAEVGGEVGGNAVQFASAASMVGFGPVTVIGKVGADPDGALDAGALAAVRHMRAHGLRPALVTDTARGTGRAIVVYLPDDRRMMLCDPGANATFAEGDLDDRALAAVDRGGVLFVSGYTLVQPDRRAAALALMNRARAAHATIALDVVPHDIDQFVATDEIVDVLTLADWLLVAEVTARRILGIDPAASHQDVVRTIGRLAHSVAVFAQPGLATVASGTRVDTFSYEYTPGGASRGQSARSQAALLARYVRQGDASWI